MKKNLRIFIILSVLLVSLIILSKNVYAVSFNDIDENTEYYDSIMELVNDGIIFGYEDGTFKPEKKISVAEAIVLTERAFGNPNNLPDWSKWEELTKSGYTYKTDWTIDFTSFFNKYDLSVNFELGSQLVLNSNKAIVLQPEIFGYSNNHRYYSNVLFRGYNSTKQFYEMMNRAEFCDLIVWAKKNIHNIPDYSVDFPVNYKYIGNKYDEHEKMVFEASVLGSFLNAPEWLLNYYDKSNGRIRIVEESSWDDKFKNADGYYEHIIGAPLISVRIGSPTIALHELGHFVWFSEDIVMPEEIMNEEIDAIKKISMSNYCETDIKEYFAEAFYCYYLNNKRIQNEAPKTYEFINKIVIRLEEKYK